MIVKRGLSYLPSRKTRPISKEGLTVIPCGTGSLCQPDSSFTPADLPNLALWLDASTIETDGSVLNGSNVSLWRNKGGDDDAIQNTATLQPLFTTINSKRAVYFDQDTMAIDNINYNEHNIFLVVKHTGGQDWISNGTSMNNKVLLQKSTTGNLKGHFWTTSGAKVNEGSSIGNDVYIAHQQAQNGSWKGYFNNVEQWSDTFTNTSNDIYTTYLSTRSATPEVESGRIYLYEVVILDGEISETDRLKLTNYLNTKWGAY